jgi:hypothetical protein
MRDDHSASNLSLMGEIVSALTIPSSGKRVETVSPPPSYFVAASANDASAIISKWGGCAI